MNIFEKDFLIIPINKNSHWYLAIICYPKLSEPLYKNSPNCLSKKEKYSTDKVITNHSSQSSGLDSIYQPTTENTLKTSLKTYSLRNNRNKINTAEINMDSDSADEADDGGEETKSEVFSPESLKKLGPCLKRSVVFNRIKSILIIILIDFI